MPTDNKLDIIENPRSAYDFVSFGAEKAYMTSPDKNCAALTIKGGRGNNEDAALIADNLIIIADGMGGPAAGEIAAHEAIVAAYHELIKDEEQQLTRNPFDVACQALQTELQSQNTELRSDSGSTLVIAKKRMLDAKTVYFEVGHVGDSHVIAISLDFSLQGLGIHTESHDQSWIQWKLDKIPDTDPLDRYTDYYNNIVSNVIKADDKTCEPPEIFTIEGNAGDIIVIACTDGVTDFVTPEEIENIVIDYMKENIQRAKTHQAVSNTTESIIDLPSTKPKFEKEDLPTIIQRIKDLALSRQNKTEFQILLKGTERTVYHGHTKECDNITVAAMI